MCTIKYKMKIIQDKNSPGDEIANVNFFYDDIIHVLEDTKKRTDFV